MCGFRFIVLSRVVPRSIAESWISTWLFLTVMGIIFLEFWRVMIISWVFLAFSLMNQSSHQSSSSSTCFWRWASRYLGLWWLVYIAMSSAYCITWQAGVTGMSLTNRMKSSGLSMLPWGIPASSFTTSERVFPILTWMVLSVRNEEIILRMSPGSSMS